MTGSLLTIDQLAELLNVAPKTLYHLRYRGEAPPAIRVGGALRWRREDVEAWLQKRADNPQPAA